MADDNDSLFGTPSPTPVLSPPGPSATDVPINDTVTPPGLSEPFFTWTVASTPAASSSPKRERTTTANTNPTDKKKARLGDLEDAGSVRSDGTGSDDLEDGNDGSEGSVMMNTEEWKAGYVLVHTLPYFSSLLYRNHGQI